MTITWQNDCQVPTSGTIDNTNTGTGTNIVNGGTNNAVASSGSVGTGNTFTPTTSGLPTVTGLTISRCWAFTQNSANQLTEYADGTSGQTHFKWYSLVNLDAAPAASLSWGRAYTNTSHATIAFTWQVTTTRKVHVSESGGSTSTDSTGQLTAGVWYLEAFEYDQSTNTASITYYQVGSNTVQATSTLTGVTGSYSIVSVRFGIGTASAFSGNGFKRCLIQMGDASVNRPDASSPAPVARAGLDQTVNPYDTVTLDGTASTNSTGYTWVQTAGPPVTLSDPTVASPTFTAPAPQGTATLTFSLVTDNGSVVSTADTVVITVLPHTIWLINATGLTPIKMTVL